MKHTDEYRNPTIARRLIADIQAMGGDTMRIMEFCGGHTHSIMRYGIRQALDPAVRMLSGPGCPVCVTSDADIDRAIDLAHRPGVTVATFGDMIRVPGSRSSLQEARAAGAQVQVVYSALDALDLARRHPQEAVVMLGIGFETTAPTVAASLVQAHKEGLSNYYVYCMHKLTPPAMRAILDSGEVRVDAILGPGHVTAITGWRAWEFLPKEYGIPCAVSGFEPVDILQAVRALKQADASGTPQVVNPYSRGVTAEGNAVAQAMLERVFRVTDARWRGLGEIPASGLALSDEYAAHDAEIAFDLGPAPEGDAAHARGCRCGEVLRGVIDPPECPMFGRACTPVRPVGPCMVSAEGACAAHYRYGGTTD
ncbi:MAG TPA: hydrogenase formation protein HypD [Chloroflexi bacterium]|jgi:hydrogenase expression/formation protein HypD|nr:hydrogenase formation protein HypD [Chloroflexota bacterium]